MQVVPYTEFEPGELATQLHQVVVANESLLKGRNINGPIVRYGGELELGIQNVEKGQHEHQLGELGHFAIVGYSGDVIGAGSIYPELGLRKLRLPIPPALAVGRLSVKYPYADPNIHAWVGDEDPYLQPDYTELSEAYKELLQLARGESYRTDVVTVSGDTANAPRSAVAWTLEPWNSPRSVHEAIESSGLAKIATRRFDDGETRKRIPPLGTLYADIRGAWLSSHGAQHELRTGEHQSFLDEAHNEIISRNPRG